MGNEIKEMEKQIADHYGYYLQNLKCMEEMSELTKAFCKFQFMIERSRMNEWRVAARTPEYKDLVEELADVQIMLDQMRYLLGCDKVVDAIIFNKTFRMIKKIREEKTNEHTRNGIQADHG